MNKINNRCVSLFKCLLNLSMLTNWPKPEIHKHYTINEMTLEYIYNSLQDNNILDILYNAIMY